MMAEGLGPNLPAVRKESTVNIQMLKNAVRMYVGSAECHDKDQVVQALEAYAELQMAEETAELSGSGSYEVYAVPTMFIDEYLNVTCYDMVGPIIKRHMTTHEYSIEQVRCSSYSRACITAESIEVILKSTSTIGVTMDLLPRSIYRDAITFIIDLWLDNEKDGANRPDGTFAINQ